MFYLKAEKYLGALGFILILTLFAVLHIIIVAKLNPWFSIQSIELWKWVYFIDVLRWFINHLISKLPALFFVIWFLILVFNRETHKKLWRDRRQNIRPNTQQKTFIKKLGSILILCKKIISLHSRYFWWFFLCWGWWYIVSTMFSFVNIWEVSDNREWIWNFLQEIKNTKELWVNLWLENFYDIQMISNIEYSLWYRWLWMLTAILVSWLISLLSFWNKVWKWVSSFILVMALLFFLIWRFLHFLLIELNAWIS